MYERFAALYDGFMADVDYDRWCGYIIELLKRSGVNDRGRVLDAACGTGNATIPLAEAGYVVTGVDASLDMLEIASGKARKNGLKLPFVNQELTKLSVHRPQDAVVCICDGVNYLTELKEVEAFFRCAYECLKPRGTLLFDVSSRHKLENILGMNTFAETNEKAAYIWQNAYDKESRLVEMELTFFSSVDGKSYERFGERHVQRAHETDELIDLLNRCGFVNTEAFDAFTLDAVKPTSERIQFSAAKE